MGSRKGRKKVARKVPSEGDRGRRVAGGWLAQLLQLFDPPTGDDPGRGLRSGCASVPQVHQDVPVRFSPLLAPSPACHLKAKLNQHCYPLTTKSTSTGLRQFAAAAPSRESQDGKEADPPSNPGTKMSAALQTALPGK